MDRPAGASDGSHCGATDSLLVALAQPIQTGPAKESGPEGNPGRWVWLRVTTQPVKQMLPNYQPLRGAWADGLRLMWVVVVCMCGSVA